MEAECLPPTATPKGMDALPTSVDNVDCLSNCWTHVSALISKDCDVAAQKWMPSMPSNDASSESRISATFRPMDSELPSRVIESTNNRAPCHCAQPQFVRISCGGDRPGTGFCITVTGTVLDAYVLDTYKHTTDAYVQDTLRICSGYICSRYM